MSLSDIEMEKCGIEPNTIESGETTEFRLVKDGQVQKLFEEITKTASQLRQEGFFVSSHENLGHLFTRDFHVTDIKDKIPPEEAQKKVENIKSKIDGLFKLLEEEALKKYLCGLQRTFEYHNSHTDVAYVKYYPDKQILFELQLKFGEKDRITINLDELKMPNKIILKPTIKPCILEENRYKVKTPFRCLPVTSEPNDCDAYETVLKALINNVSVKDILSSPCFAPVVHYTPPRVLNEGNFYVVSNNPTAERRECAVNCFYSFFNDIEKNREQIEKAASITMFALTTHSKLLELEKGMESIYQQEQHRLDRMWRDLGELKRIAVEVLTVPRIVFKAQEPSIPCRELILESNNNLYSILQQYLQNVVLSPKSRELKDYVMTILKD